MQPFRQSGKKGDLSWAMFNKLFMGQEVLTGLPEGFSAGIQAPEELRALGIKQEGYAS